jgi:hypothetical protein
VSAEEKPVPGTIWIDGRSSREVRVENVKDDRVLYHDAKMYTSTFQYPIAQWHRRFRRKA